MFPKASGVEENVLQNRYQKKIDKSRDSCKES